MPAPAVTALGDYRIEAKPVRRGFRIALKVSIYNSAREDKLCRNGHGPELARRIALVVTVDVEDLGQLRDLVRWSHNTVGRVARAHHDLAGDLDDMTLPPDQIDQQARLLETASRLPA